MVGPKQAPPHKLGIASAEEHRLAMTLGVFALNEWCDSATRARNNSLGCPPVSPPNRNTRSPISELDKGRNSCYSFTT